MSEILRYFPGTPRPVQIDVLEELERHWEDNDVFVISMPVGSGKSYTAGTIVKWKTYADIITPTNLLVDQYVKDFPEFPKLFRKNMYACCAFYKRRRHAPCARQRDMRKIMSLKHGVMNYYMYMSLYTRQRECAPILIVDEAHNLIPTMQSLMAKKMWKHEYHWPENLKNNRDLQHWAEMEMENYKFGTRYETLKLVADQCKSHKPTYVFEKTQEWWHKTKEAEYRDLINIKPVEVARGPQYFWGKHVKKLVLMSSTISRKDIEAMGLSKRRVKYIEAGSPIPAKNRPIYVRPVTSVTRETLPQDAEKIANYVENVLLPQHEGEKGVIHATYQMAGLLRHFLHHNNRFIWHTKDDKGAKYQEFRNSPSEQGKVLVASGLYEGIDLPGDLGRWQVIAKVPWISLGDRAIKYKAETDDEWYRWETLKSLIQATGRVCRGPNDYGATYIVDNTFERLYNKSDKLLPGWFKEAVNFEEISNEKTTNAE